jgi:2-dehydropantoate 2-reductase
MWNKWILLAAVGGINSLMRGTIGEVASAPGGEAFTLAILEEIVSTVSASGHPPATGFANQVKTMLTDKSSTQTSSMYRDLVAGRPVEAEQIIGDLAARARKVGVPTPLLDAAFSQLSIYQSRLPAGR